MTFSKARLERVHDVLAPYVDRGELPGLVSLVSRGDEVHVDAMGTLALDGDNAMRRDSIFRISSVTKPMTAAAAMLLIEDCELRLDDPVDRWLPELANRRVLRRLDGPVDDTVPAKRAITVRDLLTFTSGYGLVMAAPGSTPIQVAMDELQLAQGRPAPATAPDPDEWTRRLGTLPLLHQPGEQWTYNTASDVLGVLIARVVGSTVRSLPAGATVRAPRNARYRIQRADRRVRPLRDELSDESRNERAHALRRAVWTMEPPACFPRRKRRSRLDDR